MPRSIYNITSFRVFIAYLTSFRVFIAYFLGQTMTGNLKQQFYEVLIHSMHDLFVFNKYFIFANDGPVPVVMYVPDDGLLMLS